MSDTLLLAYRRALAAADPALVQLWFAATALDRYRGQAAVQVIRTNTVGRLSKARSWSLDFGIAPDEQTLHASWGALTVLPEDERGHWALHAAVATGASEMFMRMQLSPGSCFDDGEVRTW